MRKRESKSEIDRYR